MAEEVYHDPSRPIPELTEEQRKKEAEEIVKRSVAAHAELAKMKPSPSPEEIQAFRESAPAPVAEAAKPEVEVLAKPAVVEKVTEAKHTEERGLYETRAARARARGGET